MHSEKAKNFFQRQPKYNKVLELKKETKKYFILQIITCDLSRYHLLQICQDRDKTYNFCYNLFI